jgi:hypothetical protein
MLCFMRSRKSAPITQRLPRDSRPAAIFASRHEKIGGAVKLFLFQGARSYLHLQRSRRTRSSSARLSHGGVFAASAETFTTRHPRRHQSLQSGTPPRVPSDIRPMMRSSRRSCRPLNVTEHSSAERRLVRVCVLPDDRSSVRSRYRD